MKGNALVGQSGGPTSVINASLAGVIEEARRLRVEKLYGAVRGIEGVLREELVDLSAERGSAVEGLKYRPGAVLGGCRYMIGSDDIGEKDIIRIFDVFKKHGIRYFFYNGGNDSMDTADKIHRASKKIGWDVNVIGIPKTIDNDLFGTDHCPGYGSCSKYLVTSVVEAGIHTESMYSAEPVTILVTVGRNAGWLPAACGLARRNPGEAPHIILFPEIPFDEKLFVAKVREVYDKTGGVFIVSGEGLRDREGNFISAKYDGMAADAFGHPLLGDVPVVLKSIIEERLNLKTRWIKPDICQQAAAHMSSAVDAEEAVMCGRAAVRMAVEEGLSGYMTTIERLPGPEYAVKPGKVELSKVANVDRFVPRDFIDEEGFFTSVRGLDYVRPLILGERSPQMKDGFPVYSSLKLIRTG